jgi:ribonuclease VapC
MNKVVLDASALLALLNQERGARMLTARLLSIAVSSTVNLAEVHGKLVARGMPSDEAWDATLAGIREAAPFTLAHARIAEGLATKTRHLGLSLGDRACLALGISLNLPVYTADRSWKDLSVGIDIRIIR